MNLSFGGVYSKINNVMKLLVLCCLVAAVAAAPASISNPGDVQLLKYSFDNVGPYGFRYSYEQSDGNKAEALGELINEGKENAAIAIKGSYEFIAPNGIKYTVTYVADEGGYQPTVEEGPGYVNPSILASINGGK